MNPWTAILQSVHSALIDELTDRHPEPKPELGMPLRENHYRVPDPSLTSVLACGIEISGQRGVLFLAGEPGFAKKLGLAPTELFQAVLKRAGGEFMHRGIRPVFSAPVTVLGSSPLPGDLPVPGRVVWIPFKIPAGTCFLGLGA
ncbi:MAG TPA: hypothetical protein VM598_06875 [Bdellovibrionota bacterium]|nr:hypothetical protein [Bdellovibrionota bacterium]